MTMTDVRRLKDATRDRILELQRGLRAQHHKPAA
jgi:hypothetical protein